MEARCAYSAQLRDRVHCTVVHFCSKRVGRLLQIRDTYSMVVSAKADYLKEHPELDKESTGGAGSPKAAAP